MVGCAARIKSVNVSSCSAAASSVLRLPNKCSGHSEEELRFVFRVEVFSEVDSYLRCKLVMLCVHYAVTERCRGLEVEMIVPSSLLVGDSPLSGGQHIVEGVSANASPGEEVT